VKQLPAPERPVILDPFPRCLQSGDITLHAAQRQLGQFRQLLCGNTGVLADERKDFQPVDQLFAVLVRFFALAVCSEQQILELVLDGVKGIVAFEELPQLLRRLRLAAWQQLESGGYQLSGEAYRA